MIIKKKEVTKMVKKVKISHKKSIGYRISDIGTGLKEYNIKTDSVWNKKKKRK